MTVDRLRECLRHALDFKITHIAIVVLTLLDVVIIAVELSIEHNKDYEHVSEILFLVSYVIICLFMLEIALTLFAHGLRWLYKGPLWGLHLLDFVVIVANFSLETALHGTAREYSALPILLRLWRVAKIVTVSVMGYGEREQRRIATLEREMQLLTTENAWLRSQIGTTTRHTI